MQKFVGTFEIENFALQCGLVLPRAVLCYATYGELNESKSNAILYPTSYGAQHTDIEWLIGPERILDPSKYFIIIPNMFGNGLSTSPSNVPEPFDGSYLDLFSHVDNVTAQRKLLSEQFGIEKLKLIYGWSMGAQQSLHWGAMFPTQVERIFATCGTAKTTPHNKVFLAGLKAALTADPAWHGDRFTSKPTAGLKAYGRVYAGWALSQEYYRREAFKELGYASLEDYLIRDWEAAFLKRDAANLLSMLSTWSRSDISQNDLYQGDIKAALAAIQAKTYIVPCSHDLYFTPEDCQAEAEQIPGAEFRVIESCWGHRAGNPARSPADEAFLRSTVNELLNL